MTDTVSPEVRKKTMQAVKSAKTKLEDRVTKELWRRGHRFRRNPSDLPGKPDIAIKKKKVAVFIDSCFWHGCPQHCRMPSSNQEYWNKKIAKNKARDEEVTNLYRNMGWTIIRIWEHEIMNDLESVILKISTAFKDA